MIETRNGSDDVLKQHVWGMLYVDELVQIGLNDDPTDAGEDDCETYLFAAQDLPDRQAGANFNVTDLFESDGDLAERYAYTPYGQRQVYKPADGSDDFGTEAIAYTQPWVISSEDQPYGLCDVGHQGLLHDKEFGLIHNRARSLHPRLGRFLQRDPLGYVDGMSLYEYAASSPSARVDPSGSLVFIQHVREYRVGRQPWDRFPTVRTTFEDVVLQQLRALCPCVEYQFVMRGGRPRPFRRTLMGGDTRSYFQLRLTRRVKEDGSPETVRECCACLREQNNRAGCRMILEIATNRSYAAYVTLWDPAAHTFWAGGPTHDDSIEAAEDTLGGWRGDPQNTGASYVFWNQMTAQSKQHGELLRGENGSVAYQSPEPVMFGHELGHAYADMTGMVGRLPANATENQRTAHRTDLEVPAVRMGNQLRAAASPYVRAENARRARENRAIQAEYRQRLQQWEQGRQAGRPVGPRPLPPGPRNRWPMLPDPPALRAKYGNRLILPPARPILQMSERDALRLCGNLGQSGQALLP